MYTWRKIDSMLNKSFNTNLIIAWKRDGGIGRFTFSLFSFLNGPTHWIIANERLNRLTIWLNYKTIFLFHQLLHAHIPEPLVNSSFPKFARFIYKVVYFLYKMCLHICKIGEFTSLSRLKFNLCCFVVIFVCLNSKWTA